MVEINVEIENLSPKTKNPIINKDQQIIYDQISTLKIFSFPKRIDIPLTPPVIILKGTKNIPVPKARIKVPNKTRITLKIVCKTRLILGFNFLIILANFLSLHL